MDGTITFASVCNAVDVMFQKSPYLTATMTTASRTGQ
jgi:hypothetical protein